MCDTLVELQEAMRRYAASFDPSLLGGTDAAAVMGLAGAIERMAATVKGLAAARVSDSGVWKAGGDRSAAHHLARTTGTSVGQAGEAIETARRLARLPGVAAAARSGQLSAQQAAAVAGACGADPSAESRLLEKARTSSLAELRDECARTRAAADPDPEARRKAIHDGRYLRGHTDAEGAWHLHMRDNPEVGAEILAALAPIRDRLFRAARAEGRHEPAEAYAADALAELARGGVVADGPRAGRSRAKLIARVDLLALLRGRPIEGEVCELAGFGPVAASAIRDLIDTGDPFLAAVITRGRTGRGRRPPRPASLRGPTDRPGMALPELRGRGLRLSRLPGERPPRRLGRQPRHHPRPARPAVFAPSRPQDHRQLGAGRRAGETGLRASRGFTSPPTSPRRLRERGLHVYIDAMYTCKMDKKPLRVPISVASQRGVSWLSETAAGRRVVLTRFGAVQAVVDSAERIDEGAARIRDAARLVVERYAEAGLGRANTVALADACAKLGLDPARVRARAEALRER
ncbi:MAG: DUF222 domain-containing protein [Solirubrobacterales bacterium]